MHANAEVIERFYQAFQRRDHEAMGACYADDVHFSDPVFPDLKGDAARAMWRMLCTRGADLQLEFSDVTADDQTGSAKWVARYTFSGTGRKVVNRIEARFRFRDGKIVEHTDRFDFWAWSSQALGMTGRLLGWTPLLLNKVRSTAARGLQKFS